MILAFDTVLQGVLLGGLYALFAAGLSLIFGVMRLVNLAHGDMIVLAAFLIFAIAQALGVGLGVALLIAVPVMFAIGYALQYFLLNRVVGEGHPAAAARHLRPVDLHPERPAGGLLRRQPSSVGRRAGKRLDCVGARLGDRRRAADDAGRGDRRSSSR